MGQYNIISISGLPKSGKSTLLDALRIMPAFEDWSVKSIGDYFKDSHKKSNKKSLSFQSYLDGLTNEEILRVNEDIRTAATKGKIFVDSRYSIKNCEGLSSLNIFLTAPFETRVGRVKEEDAANALRAREKWELEKGKELYGYDYTDPSHYHIVINSGKLSLMEEMMIIESLF